jgi:hypothetical protein
VIDQRDQNRVTIKPQLGSLEVDSVLPQVGEALCLIPLELRHSPSLQL